EAFNNKGSSLFSLHRYDQALESFDQALRINPGYVEALNNKGNVLKELKEYNAALLSFDKAIFLNNNHALAHNGKGAVLLELLQYQAAISCFDAALQSKPNYESAFNNRSIALWKLNLLDEALTSVDKAIELKPDYAEAYVTKANVLIAKNLLTDALVCFDKAIYLQPAYADAYWNKSLLQLLIGDFRGGWENYEWRWKIKDGLLKKVDLKLPLWLGKDSLRGKHILLHWEQGLGDTIQFSRFLPLVTEQANTVVAIVQSPLIELISAAYPDVHFQLKEDPLPTGIDFYCPLLSLPLALNSCPDTIPFSKGYLSADADKIRYWSALLGEQKSLRVGLAWSGSEGHKNDGNRSIRLEQLIPFLPSGCEYVCLQKDIRQSDEAALSGSQIRCFSEQLNDFTDTAALCELMDLVISVDTSIAHLSGALGKSAWVLLPYRPDWRWMLDRNDSVWYEKMLLIRQATAGDWESALLQLRTKLDELLNSSDDK
ncbi:MAG: tetratricopeptide repeat protein, partial [Pararheinheimera sp.]|nr:tetratricopeptide repeat protein [Rheinheimera sp.]